MKMIALKPTRGTSFIKRFTKKVSYFLKAVLRFKNFVIWSKFNSNSGNSQEYVVHLLVVGKVIYAQLAKTAVMSFLYYHPNSRIVIHCDQITEGPLKQVFSRYLSKKSIKILSDCNLNTTWQENKLKVIFSMNGTKDFFMDADLRWNGPITNHLSGLIFFVREFAFEDRSPFRQIGQLIESKLGLKNLQMYNTSFFSFGGLSVSKIDLESAYELASDSSVFYKSANIGRDDMIFIGRLSEQIALSVWSHKWSKQILFLKDKDAIFDQSFVESSYYGATGNQF